MGKLSCVASFIAVPVRMPALPDAFPVSVLYLPLKFAGVPWLTNTTLLWLFPRPAMKNVSSLSATALAFSHTLAESMSILLQVSGQSM